MFTKSQFVLLCTMQNELQVKTVGPDWMTQPLRYGTAISAELAEANDHYGWKWWAKQEPNKPQAAMELVDTLHFALAACLQGFNGDIDLLFDQTMQNIENIPAEGMLELGTWDFIDFTSQASIAANTGAPHFTIYLLTRAGEFVDMPVDEMFKAYIGKNVLNGFRKQNGYKEGTYIKTWDGEEDNVYLQTLLDNNDVNDPNFTHTILNQLAAKYQAVIEAAN